MGKKKPTLRKAKEKIMGGRDEITAVLLVLVSLGQLESLTWEKEEGFLGWEGPFWGADPSPELALLHP